MTETVTYAERWSEPRAGAGRPDRRRGGPPAPRVRRAVHGRPRPARAARWPTSTSGSRRASSACTSWTRRAATTSRTCSASGDGDDRLFLERATWRTYGDDGEVAAGESYFFDRNGTVHLERKDYVRREAERGEKQDDVSGNWEPVPEFGEFESIARPER